MRNELKQFETEENKSLRGFNYLRLIGKLYNEHLIPANQQRSDKQLRNKEVEGDTSI